MDAFETVSTTGLLLLIFILIVLWINAAIRKRRIRKWRMTKLKLGTKARIQLWCDMNSRFFSFDVRVDQPVKGIPGRYYIYYENFDKTQLAEDYPGIFFPMTAFISNIDPPRDHPLSKFWQIWRRA